MILLDVAMGPVYAIMGGTLLAVLAVAALIVMLRINSLKKL